MTLFAEKEPMNYYDFTKDSIDFNSMLRDFFGINKYSTTCTTTTQALDTKEYEVTPVAGYEGHFYGKRIELKEKKYNGVDVQVFPVITKYYIDEYLIRNTPNIVTYLVSPDDKIIDMAIKYDPSLCVLKKKLTKEQVIEAVKKDWRVLKNIDPKLIDDDVITTAIIINGEAIQYAPKQTDKLKKLALDSSPSAIQFIKDATAEQKLEAIKKDNRLIKFL